MPPLFQTQYRAAVTFNAPHGSRVKNVYASRYKKDGSLEIYSSTTKDVYAEIQSYALSADINNIVSRFKSGDTSVIARRQGIYADISDMPTTAVEALNLVHGAKQVFYDLPVDVRARYSHNYAQFISAMDSPQFVQDMKQYLGVPASKTSVSPKLSVENGGVLSPPSETAAVPPAATLKPSSPA